MFTLIIEDKHGGIADEYSFEEGEFYIGRSHTSDIILPSDNVSRRHARLYTVDGKCYIEDLNSSNGVFVNGRRIHEVFQIQRSAQVKVGDYYLHIESDAEAAADEEKTFCRLVGKNLAFANQVFRIQRKVNLVGRGKDCTVTIIDPSVSRIHAKLSVERSGALTLEDLKSSNGTFVNDERVEVTTLQHDDVVRFGNVEFHVQLAEQEAPAAAAPPARSRTGERALPPREPRESREARASGDDRDREIRRAQPIVPLPPSGPRPSLAQQWEDEERQKKTPGWVLPVVIGGVAAILITLLLIAFKDEIFGGSKAPEVVTTAPTTAPTATTTPPKDEPKVEDKATEADKKKAELAKILEVGRDYLKKQQWDQALERYQAALDIDPFNDEAKTAQNRIKVWKKHRERLEEARKFANQNPIQRGTAATILREIDDTSHYYAEAREELSKLLAAKPTILLTADNLVRQKDCTGALDQLKEAKLIDPQDASISTKMGEIEAMVGTKKCAK
ncbi:MAG: FHA domain-containing protein [Deltaproteobacteria bacterium]|nr:FHA domain-containing protein [Deltaproteobacteria bacterium]